MWIIVQVIDLVHDNRDMANGLSTQQTSVCGGLWLLEANIHHITRYTTT